jgi:hypothetical protein
MAANVIGISPLAGSPGVIHLNFVAPQPGAGSSSVQLQAAVGNFSSNVVTLDIAP